MLRRLSTIPLHCIGSMFWLTVQLTTVQRTIRDMSASAMHTTRDTR